MSHSPIPGDTTTLLPAGAGLFPNAVPAGRSDAPIYFLHVPKTGGASLLHMIESLYSASELWIAPYHPGWLGLIGHTPEELRQVQFIAGHFGGHLHQFYGFPLRYITFLRDPLQRALSHYRHVLRDPSHYFHGLAQELGSFGAYLRDERTQPTVVNFQLRSIGANFDVAGFARGMSGEQLGRFELDRLLDTAPLAQSAAELLRCAEARLGQMCFVGLTERFADSVALLWQVFGWPQPTAVARRNADPDGAAAASVPAADVDLFNRLNAAEIELYHGAKARFERDWERSRFVYPQLHAFVSYAQNAEDVLLHRVLRDVRDGFYVDVGANDPTGDSVTRAFYDRGWHGVNVEPVPALHAALVRDRARDVNVRAAAGSASAELTLYEIEGTGLSTLDRDVALRHRAQGFPVAEMSIPVRTLDAILADVPHGDIHFLKVDVEGWEREVLLGLDLKVTRPWVVVVEATEPNTEIPSFDGWEPLLLGRGYRFVFFDGLNRYYLADERAGLQAAFSRPVNCGDGYIRQSELAAVRGWRAAEWRLRGMRPLAEVEALRVQIAALTEARAKEQEEAVKQIEALKAGVTSAETYARSLIHEIDALRARHKAAEEAFAQERATATAYARSLEVARAAEHASAIEQIAAQIARAEKAETYAKSLVEGRKVEQANAIQQIEALSAKVREAEYRARPLIVRLFGSLRRNGEGNGR